MNNINFDLNFELESLDEPDGPEPGRESRFQTLSSEQIEQIASDRNEKSTGYNTSWDVRLFKEWCKSKGKDTNFEKMPVEDLTALLRVFYAEVRNKKGERYAKQSYVGIRAAIHRHLTGEPFCRQVNILQDREFQAANNVFRGVLKQMKREGLDRSQHKTPISRGDLEKLKAIDVCSPKGLQQLAWFYIEYYFCRRGREGLRSLQKDCFQFCTDSDGNEYCKMAFREATKNHPGDLNSESEKRMYATGDNLCPVKIVKEYISKLNPSCDHLFQRPNAAFHKGKTQRFDNVPLGKNTLVNMMKIISQELQLSQVYTNHCIRATVITELCKKGFDTRTIATLSGHLCEGSIKSYCHDATPTQKRLMSKTLASCLSANDNSGSEPCTSGSTFVNRVTTFTDKPSEMSHAMRLTTNLSAKDVQTVFQGCSFTGKVKVFMENSSS